MDEEEIQLENPALYILFFIPATAALYASILWSNINALPKSC
jgi:hypothetical protein